MNKYIHIYIYIHLSIYRDSKLPKPEDRGVGFPKPSWSVSGLGVQGFVLRSEGRLAFNS